MATAIFTFKTIAELVAKKTEHPVRGVEDGDVAIVGGGERDDDTLTFTALKNASPVTNAPDQYASGDGKVQWTNSSRTFGTGGIPRSLPLTVLASPTVPAGWELDSALPKAGFVMSGRQSSGNSQQLMKQGNILWCSDGQSITKYDLANNNAMEVFPHLDLPEGSYIDGQARVRKR